MKISLKTKTLLGGLLFSSATIIGQPVATITSQDLPAPGMEMDAPPPHVKHHHHGPKEEHHPETALQVLTTLSGKLLEYTANDRSEYDGFKLQSGTQTISVGFPAHAGEQLMKNAKQGSSITVIGYYESRPGVLSEFRLVTAQCANAVINAYNNPAPAMPVADEMKDFTGTVSAFRRNPDGFINGIILSGKEVIELPPSALRQLQGSIKTGDKISGSGIKVVPPAGVVTVDNTPLIRARILTLAGQSYIVQ